MVELVVQNTVTSEVSMQPGISIWTYIFFGIEKVAFLL